ncbi:hypothetical protein ACGFXB_43245 [Streptomyces canus]|uniref:hypothetical protein n=1 Tax=Streptomyces canus TaxID=58343 RepID=UPI0037148D20
MTDAEWAAVRLLLPVRPRSRGRADGPRATATGNCWTGSATWSRAGSRGGRCLRDFPTWARVYAFFRRWREHGLIAEFHGRLRGTLREREGRETEPTAGITDAQSVAGRRDGVGRLTPYDGGKKVPGRKRHIVTAPSACSSPSRSQRRTAGTPRRAC